MDYDKIISEMHGPTRIVCIQEGIACVWTQDPEKRAELKQIQKETPDLIVIEEENENYIKAFIPSDYVDPLPPE